MTTNNTFITIIAVAVAGFVIWLFAFGGLGVVLPIQNENYGGDISSGTSEENKGDSLGLRVGENALYVPDQAPSKTVVANIVVLGEPGFVVIHESNNGTPGAILGKSALLSSGEHVDIQVILSRSTKEGEVLFAMLHRDSGDSVFNAPEDLPFRAETGDVIMMEFGASSDAPVPGALELLL